MSSPNCSPLHKCVACGSDRLKLTLDLGTQPPANSYKDTKDEVQEEFPLAINRCLDCYHVQLTHIVNPDLLYKNYLYVSGTSQTMKDHFKWFAEWTLEQANINVPDYQNYFRVLDIGCNDGSQLDAYLSSETDDLYSPRIVHTHGVDPATNLHALSSTKHTVHCGYFDDEYLEKQLNYEGFDIIVAQNVFAHNPDPVSFLQRASALLSMYGRIYIQTSQADMILNNEFDTIYHEHISFYNINSMNELCKRAGVYLLDVIKCPLHGNSYIFTISNDELYYRPQHIQNLIEMERKAGLMSEQTYIEYEEKCKKVMKDLRDAVDNYVRLEVGWFAIGYGAAAKGMTLINAAKPRIDFIIDDNPLKQGKFTPGAGIPIVSSAELDKYKDACLFIPLAWNFYDEIREKIKTKHDCKYDKFVRYFPEVVVSD